MLDKHPLHNPQVVDIIEEYLLNRPPTDRTGRLHPSALYGCPRRNYWDYYESPPDDKDLRMNILLDGGTKIHELWQDYFGKADILVGNEVDLAIPELRIGGHCDSVLELYEKDEHVKKIIDIKTIDNKGFVYEKLPKKDHIRQLLLYKWLYDQIYKKPCSDDLILLYHVKGSKWKGVRESKWDFLKSDMPIEIHFSYKKHKKTLDVIIEKIKIINESIDKEQRPDEIDTDYCMFCPHKHQCSKDGKNIKHG